MRIAVTDHIARIGASLRYALNSKDFDGGQLSYLNLPVSAAPDLLRLWVCADLVANLGENTTTAAVPFMMSFEVAGLDFTPMPRLGLNPKRDMRPADGGNLESIQAGRFDSDQAALVPTPNSVAQ